MKTIISVIAVLLVFVGYIPYIHNTIKGKTKPHAYSWFVWGLQAAIIFAIQAFGGAGIGSYILLAATVLIFTVFFLSLKNGKQDITPLDTVFFIAALASIGVWFFAKQPIFSITLLCATDILGFLPTVRKAWKKPQQETLFTWEVNGFRHILTLFCTYQS